MSSSVSLYVYDLTKGIAGQLSLQLTGRQIDGVWHTSVVVFGKELFYGQGIKVTEPGKSHHGSPLRIVEMGETQIDEETFNDYISELRERYTADKYHLLNFNCNSFTNECMGFLTGGSIPPYIKSLPDDFLSTPFGAALKPALDAIFSGRSTSVVQPPRPMMPPSMASNFTITENFFPSVPQQAIAGPSSVNVPPPAPIRAQAPIPPPAPAPVPAPAPTQTPLMLPPPDNPVAAPMHINTNPASFHGMLGTHRAVVAFFTSATCGPCRMIEPVFEGIAESKSKPNGVGFAKIDLSVGLGGALAAEYQVQVTPTFLFFLDGQKMHELKGVNAPELRTQVDLLIYQAFPPHAHMSLQLPAVESISLEPILTKQIPSNIDAVFNKLTGSINAVTSWNGTVTQAQVKEVLSKTVLPFLKASTSTPPAQQLKPTPFDYWLPLTSSISANLQPGELFPLVDIWRIALLNASFSEWSATKNIQEGPLKDFVDKALQAENVPRNYLLTVLRLLANAFSNRALGRGLILSTREGTTKLLVDTLLHQEATVRTAAASLAFNIAAYLQRLRVDKLQARDERSSEEENEDWELEIVTAVLAAIDQETSSEETVHRLVACLGLLLRLSPYTEQVASLLEMLSARAVLKRKLEKGGCGENGAGKKDVRKLILEVADKLCPAM